MPYSQELNALQKTHRLRIKKIHSLDLLDYASNDYLGLSENKANLTLAYERLLSLPFHSPKASMAVNGYHQLHQELEESLSQAFGFPSCTLFGSGFLANLALFDTLVRKNDVIFIDELYHASGRYPAKLLEKQAIFFKHNDPQDLQEKIKSSTIKGRILIAIEGVYSMDGDIAKPEFAKIAQESQALLIVDEAHSSGTIGKELKGYFDYYQIPIAENFIKMGTLSKAYASYGAYVLASKNIIDFLFAKAKSSIYTTAPSLFDTALAMYNLKFLQAYRSELANQLLEHQHICQELLKLPIQSQILPIIFETQERMLKVAKELENNGFLVGSIRKPTTPTPRLRITLSAKNSPKDTQKLCKILQNFLEG